MIKYNNQSMRLLLARLFLVCVTVFMLTPIIYGVKASVTIADTFDPKLEVFNTVAWRIVSGQSIIGKSAHDVAFRPGDNFSYTIASDVFRASLSPTGELFILPPDSWVYEYAPVRIRIYSEGVSSTSSTVFKGQPMTLVIGDLANYRNGEVLVNRNEVTTVRLDMPIFNDEIDRIRVFYEHPVIMGNFTSFLVRALTSSVRLALAAAICILLMSLLLAYALVRLKVVYKNSIIAAVLIAQMFPTFLLMTAYNRILIFLDDQVEGFAMFSQLNIFVIYLGSISLSVFLVMGYLKRIDYDMEESAFIDGATPFQALIHVLVPMSKPIIAVTFMVAFVYFYAEFNLANQFLLFENTTLAAVLYYSDFYGQIPAIQAAYLVVGCLPVMLLFLIINRYLVSGLTDGSTNGQ